MDGEVALKVEVGVLKEKVSALTDICEKLDRIIEKLADNNSDMVNQIYKDMDKRKEDTVSDIKELHSRITTGNREIMEKIEHMDSAMETRMVKNAETSAQQHSEIKSSLQSDIIKVTDRVDTLEKWRWMIVGGAIVLGYIVGHFELFTKFFG